MTKKETVQATVLNLASLKAAGGMPGSLPPVKRTITWENPEGEEYSFDVYVRQQSYKDLSDIFEGKKEFSNSAVVSRLICDANAKQLFTEEQVQDFHQSLIALLVSTIGEVNGYGKKKQQAGKKSS